jgi:hypothetical protein
MALAALDSGVRQRAKLPTDAVFEPARFPCPFSISDVSLFPLFRFDAIALLIDADLEQISGKMD